MMTTHHMIKADTENVDMEPGALTSMILFIYSTQLYVDKSEPK